MKKMIAAACGIWLILSGQAFAQSENAVVVELYTSQGCSSCPPADALLGKLTGDSRVIPLALHVDYWDYLGWKDEFGSAKYTARQKKYAHHARDRMVYTPQVVVQGQSRMVGSHGSEVEAAIRKHFAQIKPVRLSINRKGATLIIQAEAVQPTKGAHWVQLVRYRPAEKVAIKRGENAGKTITYHNVVTSWQLLGKWNGSEPLLMEATAEGGDPIVVIIQADGPAEILAAARLR